MPSRQAETQADLRESTDSAFNEVAVKTVAILTQPANASGKDLAKTVPNLHR